MIYKMVPEKSWKYEGQDVDTFIIAKPYDDPRDKSNMFAFVGISGKLRNGYYFSAYCSLESLRDSIPGNALCISDQREELKLRLRFDATS